MIFLTNCTSKWINENSQKHAKTFETVSHVLLHTRVYERVSMSFKHLYIHSQDHETHIPVLYTYNPSSAATTAELPPIK